MNHEMMKTAAIKNERDEEMEGDKTKMNVGDTFNNILTSFAKTAELRKDIDKMAENESHKRLMMIEKLKIELQEMDCNLKQHKEKISTHDYEMEQMEQNMRHDINKKRELLEQVANLDIAMKAAQEELFNHKNKNNILERNFKAEETAKQQLEKKVVNIEKQVEHANVTIKNLQVNHQAQMKEKNETVKTLENNVTHLKQEIKSGKEFIDKFKQENTNEKNKMMESIRLSNEQLRAVERRKVDEHQSYEDKIKQINREKNMLLEQIVNLDIAMNAAEEELFNLKDQYNILERNFKAEENAKQQLERKFVNIEKQTEQTNVIIKNLQVNHQARMKEKNETVKKLENVVTNLKQEIKSGKEFIERFMQEDANEKNKLVESLRLSNEQLRAVEMLKAEENQSYEEKIKRLVRESVEKEKKLNIYKEQVEVLTRKNKKHEEGIQSKRSETIVKRQCTRYATGRQIKLRHGNYITHVANSYHQTVYVNVSTVKCTFSGVTGYCKEGHAGLFSAIPQAGFKAIHPISYHGVITGSEKVTVYVTIIKDCGCSVSENYPLKSHYSVIVDEQGFLVETKMSSLFRDRNGVAHKGFQQFW